MRWSDWSVKMLLTVCLVVVVVAVVVVSCLTICARTCEHIIHPIYMVITLFCAPWRAHGKGRLTTTTTCAMAMGPQQPSEKTAFGRGNCPRTFHETRATTTTLIFISPVARLTIAFTNPIIRRRWPPALGERYTNKHQRTGWYK